jgi:hypothetical protein
MAKNSKAIKEYLKKSIDIDASKLSDADAEKVAILFIKACAFETPMFAKSDAEKLGIKVDLSMF